MIPYIRTFIIMWVFFPLLRIKWNIFDRITYNFFNRYVPKGNEEIEFDYYTLKIIPK